MKMLDLADVDLDGLAYALDDHGGGTWWLDPNNGELTYVPEDGFVDEDDPSEGGSLPVEPVSSDEAYGDLEEFTGRIRDPRAREMLQRAIEGRGAFRRFKDALFEFPSLREAWFAFHDARMRRRAIRWLADEQLVDAAAADRAIAGIHDPDLLEIAGAFDVNAIASSVAAELRTMFGQRLVDVILFGSHARGDAGPDSDVDLLVVLEGPVDRFAERRRMDDVLWRHSLSHGVVITAIPMTRTDVEEAAHPLLRRVRTEGRSVA